MGPLYFDDPRWVTMAQLNELNKKEARSDEDRYKVKKGSKGTKIEYWERILKGSKEYEKYTKNWSEERKEKQQGDIVIGKYYTVFNANQIENFPELIREPALTPNQQIEELEHIITNSQAPISYDGLGRNFYRPSDDSIHLTAREDFTSNEKFYGTAIHEIAHSTGHESRLNRNLSGKFGSESYAIEELNAEFTTAFMNSRYNIERSQEQLDNHAAYLQNWATTIEKDPNILFKSIQNAEKIVEYIDENMLNNTMQKEIEETTVHTADNGHVWISNKYGSMHLNRKKWETVTKEEAYKILKDVNEMSKALMQSKQKDQILNQITGRVEWIEGQNYYPTSKNFDYTGETEESHIFLGGSDHSFSYRSPSNALLSGISDNDSKTRYHINKDVLHANEYITGKEYSGKELHQLFNDLYIDDTLNGANQYAYDKCKVILTITDKSGEKTEVPLRILF